MPLKQEAMKTGIKADTASKARAHSGISSQVQDLSLLTSPAPHLYQAWCL